MTKLNVGACVVGLLALSAMAAQAQVTTNLLTNPGAETGTIAGWTASAPLGDTPPGVDNGTFDSGINPFAGGFDFYGGSGGTDSLSQTVTLVGNQGITAAMIGTGTLQANVSFWQQGLDQGTPSDDSNITLTFLGATSNVLGTDSTAIVDSHDNGQPDAWTHGVGSFFIPVGTVSVTYTQNFYLNAGSDVDSFIDNNSLTVGTPSGSAAPEPGSFVLGGLGLLGFVGSVVRRRLARS